MGGVDQADHMAKVYWVLRKYCRWTNVIMYGFLDTSAVNSYVLYKQLNSEVSMSLFVV